MRLRPVVTILIGCCALACAAGEAFTRSALEPASATYPLSAGPRFAQARVAPTQALDPGETFRDCAECPEMVVVPPGDFSMGGEAPYEKPEHKVTIAQPFAIGRREVTFDEWEACAAARSCRNRPDDHGW